MVHYNHECITEYIRYVLLILYCKVAFFITYHYPICKLIHVNADGRLVRWYVTKNTKSQHPKVTSKHSNLKSEFTCISIQMRHWYIGMLPKTHLRVILIIYGIIYIYHIYRC